MFVGFTKSGVLVPGVLTGSNTLTGRIVNTHHSRPPVFTFFGGAPVTECWVGLNEPLGGRALYATACKKDGTFSIPNVPNGTYELAIWDDPLDLIISATTITVSSTSNKNLGDLPVTSWFGRYQGRVFQDIDGTGLPYFAQEFKRPYIYVDPVTGLESERIGTFNAGDLKPPFGAGIANNIRFRDGSIYQSTTTKDDGTFAFTEVFPFFNFMVAEIDYARYKATSATVVVDDGGGDPLTGKINADQNRAKLWNAAPGLFGSNDPALSYDPWARLSPQQQADTECPFGKSPPCYFRTESVEGGSGAILLEAIQTFLGATNHIEWGKTPYTINENGGIAGIVYYGITRAEDDPRYAAAENWEPGIPRVQVNVFLDCDGDGKADKPLNNGTGLCDATKLSGGGYQFAKPDVDNYPFCWRDPESCNLAVAQKGPEDVIRSGDGITFSYGDAFRWGTPPSDTNPTPSPTQQLHWGVGKTDSWDDSIPTGCPDVTPYKVPSTGEQLDCFDGLRNYNQARPAVFDGGFAFGRVAGQAELPMVIGAEGKGTYILEAVAPPGYLHQGNGDKNVVFGDSLKATPAALPHECVGQLLPVPEFLTLFPGEPNPNYTPGAMWNKCDMKAVPLVPGLNAAPNFFMFTEAPVAGHGVGFILDDTATEFNYLAPNFGEKYSPPHLPVSVRDWTDREITRVYSDQYGSYNFILPSSFTINPPYPSGVMPSMMVACMNHPGPITNDPVTRVAYPTPQIDPFYNRSYTTFCYTLQYLPGKTTYLDTPVLPVSAFAPVTTNPLDCECEDGTPRIASVNNGGDNGPRVPATGGPLTIVSAGTAVPVVNPAFNPAVYYNNGTCPTNPADPMCTTDPNDTRLQKNVTRDYGFGGTPGTVTLGTTTLTINSWSPTGIVATVPPNQSTGQLTITRGDNGKVSVVGITVHVAAASRKVNPGGSDGPSCGVGNAAPCKTIQGAIEAAAHGELITVAPGTYNEYVIMDKRVRLQGWGADSVTINATKSSTTALATWRARINAKATANPSTFDLLPGQTLGIDPANNEPLLFGAEEGPGILVVGKQGTPSNSGNLNNCLRAGNPNPTLLSIDGFSVTGADAGGGIFASGYACGLEVSNNRVFGNYGTYGGGIRVGHTVLTTGVDYTDAVNRFPKIHHNWVAQNGATEAGGAGGITLGTGADSYAVTSNYVCGNFSMADGGGLSHLGLSPATGSTNSPANRIASNKFIFNQTFNQAADPMGGGASIAGHIALGGGAATGTGDVVLDANLFQGNQAGAGAGGALSLARTVAGDEINLTNNMIVNNVAAYAGGGVALSSTVANNQSGVRLVNNTVASNVSTATNRQSADPANVPPNYVTLPQVAGIAVLSGASPTLLNNIIWANRSYVYSNVGTPYGALYNPSGIPSYRDLGRVAAGPPLAPTYSVLTTGGVNNNVTASATNKFEAASSTTLVVKKNEFISVIDPTQPLVLQDATVALQSALTADETGNFINVIFTPLTLWELSGPPGVARADYHISAGSAAMNAGTTGATVPSSDYDAQARVAPIDIGADEVSTLPPDLAITVHTDGRTTVARGTDNVTYTIVVRNNGQSTVTNAALSDNLPGALRLLVTSWSCSASAGSSCTATGVLNQTRGGSVTLLAGGTATYTLVGNVPLIAPLGPSTNSVTVAVANDATPADNTLADTDTIVRVGAVTFTDATVATLNLTGTSLNFGNRTGNTLSVVTLTVGGNAAVTFGSATVANGNPAAFSKGADSCSGTTKNPGDTCTITVIFNGPGGNSSRSGTLNVPYNNGAAGTVTLSLSGS